MSGVFKIGGKTVATHDESTDVVSLASDVDLSNVDMSNMTFPAGHVIQVVSVTKPGTNFNSNNLLNGTNNSAATTPTSIVSFMQTEIQPILTNSKILIRMDMFLAGVRNGPSNAFGGIGFYESSTSSPSITASNLTILNDKLYTHRSSLGTTDVNNGLDGKYIVGSSIMEYLHTHNVSSGNYAVYTATAWTSYTNVNYGYVFRPQAHDYTVTLMEIAQ